MRIASPLALIALKSRAFLNLSEEKKSNPNVRSHDIKKHRLDVFLLMSQFRRSDRYELPAAISVTLQKFADDVEASLPNQSLQASMGVNESTIREYISIMREIFGL